MYKNFISLVAPLVLIGCATSSPQPEVRKDVEPILVGIPMNEKIATSQQNINAQFELLSKVKSGQYVGKFEMVEHNNLLDARKGSKNTLPNAYNTISTEKSSISTKKDVLTEESCSPKLQEKVKRIVWQNDSANKLGKNFADAIDYTFVLNGSGDENISVTIENETLESAIKKYKVALKGKADVLVIDKNKTFNLIYKN